MQRQCTNFLSRIASQTTIFPRRHPISRFASNAKDAHLINDDIPYAYVRVVDPVTRKPLPPQPLTEVINNLATELQPKKGSGAPKSFVTQYAQLVAPPSEATDGYALAQASRRASEEKEIQFAWGIGPADVQHKLRKRARNSRANVLVDEVVEALADIGREWRIRDERRNMVAVYVQDLQRPIPHKSMLAKQAAIQGSPPNPVQPGNPQSTMQ
ncbi:hypothetical protein EDB89DRAFT_2066993 [Lactarius sanguifluus]|nr:hypothetical protein EDB89DRAFT_2066993 [Lactarius sanguifluus]